MMKMRRINIPEKILRSRKNRVGDQDLLEKVHQILHQESLKDEKIIKALQEDLEIDPGNDFKLDHLETNRIFHLDDIEKMCVEYRLRFLSSVVFKAELPYEALIRIKEVEKDHEITLKGFKIMAPASAFKLKNADDPLLFAPIANNYYYLIHSWGRDLHPLRKLLMWPIRQLENFMFFLLILSFGLTFLIPSGMFSMEQTTTEFVILFFFMFKWITGLAIFYGFKYGKNFSSAIWDSTYFNA
jgi:hypothetical protein